MNSVRTLVSMALVAAALGACSSASEPAGQSSDEALKCNGDCCWTGSRPPAACDQGSYDPPPPTPTMGATCPNVYPQCATAPVTWDKFVDGSTLAGDGCQSPIAWGIPGTATGEFVALCPTTTSVASWVAAHSGSEEVQECDACLGAPGPNSTWVRLVPNPPGSCGTPPVKNWPSYWCLPNCPSGCLTPGF